MSEKEFCAHTQENQNCSSLQQQPQLTNDDNWRRVSMTTSTSSCTSPQNQCENGQNINTNYQASLSTVQENIEKQQHDDDEPDERFPPNASLASGQSAPQDHHNQMQYSPMDHTSVIGLPEYETFHYQQKSSGNEQAAGRQLQSVIDEDTLKQGLNALGGIDNVIEHNIWADLCLTIGLPAYNINIVEFIREYCLAMHQPSEYNGIIAPIVDLTPHVENNTRDSDLFPSRINSLKLLLCTLQSGTLNEVDFALNSLFALVNSSSNISKIVSEDHILIRTMLCYAGVFLEDNSNSNFGNVTHFYDYLKATEVFETMNPILFWIRTLDSQAIITNLVPQSILKNFNLKYYHAQKQSYFGQYSKESNPFVSSHHYHLSIIATILLRIIQGNNTLPYYTRFQDNFIFFALACAATKDKYLFMCGIDLMLEISIHHQLDSKKSSSMQTLEFIKQNLLSLDATNILKALNVLVNLTKEVKHKSNIFIIDQYFTEHPKCFEIILNCLSETCDPIDGPVFSTIEILRLFALEFLFNISFQPTQIMYQKEFLLLESLTHVIMYMVQLCSMREMQSKSNVPVPSKRVNSQPNNVPESKVAKTDDSDNDNQPNKPNATEKPAPKRLKRIDKSSKYVDAAPVLKRNSQTGIFIRKNLLKDHNPQLEPGQQTLLNMQMKQYDKDFNQAYYYSTQSSIPSHYISYIAIIYKNIIIQSGFEKLEPYFNRNLDIILRLSQTDSGTASIFAGLFEVYQKREELFDPQANKQNEVFFRSLDIK